MTTLPYQPNGRVVPFAKVRAELIASRAAEEHGETLRIAATEIDAAGRDPTPESLNAAEQSARRTLATIEIIRSHLR